MPHLSIILVNYNEREHLARVLAKLPSELEIIDHEIIVVDNESHDGSADLVEQQFPTVKLIRSGGNLMYGKGNNLGMRESTGEWILILNPDVDWQAGQLRSFIQSAERRAPIGMAGPRIEGSDGRLQWSSHRTFPNPWTVFVDYCLPVQQLFLRLPWHPYLHSTAMHTTIHKSAHLTGACLLFPRSVFEQTHGMDQGFTMYLEETEWQRRIADLHLDRWFISSSTLTHFGSTEKRFAQANRHYLWGLWHYAKLHWRGSQPQMQLLISLWLANLISVGLLLLFLIPSLILGRVGRRIRHYLRQYLHLTVQLLMYPTHAPKV